MSDLFKTRTDGPNTTAANKTVSFSDGFAQMAMHAQDEVRGGIPSRVVSNMALTVTEGHEADTSKYAAKGLESELRDLSSTGREQLVTPVADDADSAEYKRLASANGASYEETAGAEGRTGVFKPGVAPSLDSVADGFKVATALQNDYSDDEVRSYLAGQGYDEAQTATMFEQSQKVVAARDAGYSDDEIGEFLRSSEITAGDVQTTPVEVEESEEWIATQWGAVKKKNSFEQIVSSDTMSAEELLSSMKVLAPNMSSMTTRVAGFFGNQEAAVKAEKGALASRTRIIAMASERGLDLAWDERLGQFIASTEQGPVVVEEGIWDSLLSESGEITGAVAGGVAGLKLGGRGGPWGAFFGSMAGAAAGAIAGTELDYLREAITLQEDIEGKVMAHKALTAAEMSVMGDVLGFGLVRATGATYKGLARVKDFVLDGNTKGAYETLKQLEYLTDDQAQELVTQLSRVTKGPLPGKKAEEHAIAAAVTTKPGAEGLVAAAASLDAQASRAVGKSIDDRAKDLLASTAELSGDNLGRILREDLGNHVADVKNFYGQVKAKAAQSPRSANFRFDFDKLAIKPVLATLQKNISDPAVLEKFTLQASRIRDMSDARTFGDLLELRQVVNEFKFNRRISKTKDFETLNNVLGNIDGAIRQGAGAVLENPKAWLKDYDTARIQYAKMKQLERNVMYKALTREGVNEKDVVRSLSRYITALDGTYNDLVGTLPKEMRGRIEAATLDTLANKFTAGVGEGQRATNFPMLDKELEMVSFSSPGARQMKSAISELANVFKNDVPLSQITGNVQIPKFQSYLTADPIVRAKYEIASKTFNYVKTLLPNKEQGTLALVRRTAKVLESPLNSKSVRELMEEAAGKVDLAPEIRKMQQEAVRASAAGKDISAPRVTFYGTGKVLSPKGSGPSQAIPLHRIATKDVAGQIAEAEGVNPADSKLLDKLLTQHGYKAVQQGTDRVRLL